MGVVYRAHDTLLERVVALKIIATSIEDNPELRERFFREARAAGQLSHRNIITIHDLGEHEGQPYLAMEFLTGEDLQHRLARQEPMSLRRKLEVAAEICDGLSYAHRRGLIHRDIKPANIFITDDGVVKLLDFGLARMVASELTRSNTMMGTVNYMAPEQVRGERSDHRADIFSLGVVLYEMLSGRKAFQGDSFATTMYKILQDVPEPLLKIDSSLPPEIVWLVEKALAKPRDERYQDLVDLGRDLAIIRQHLSGGDALSIGGSPLSSHRTPSDPPRSAGVSFNGTTISATPVPRLDRPPSGAPASTSRAGWIAAGLVVALLASGAGWYASRRDSPAVVTHESAAPAQKTAPQAAPTIPAPAPTPATEPLTSPLPVATPEDPRAQRRVADDARLRMTRAKIAARQIGSVATGSAAYAAAARAEAEGSRLYRARQLPEAAAKFFDASELFRTAAVTTVPAASGDRGTATAPRVESPATAAPTQATPPVPAPGPGVPTSEGQVQLPPPGAPSVAPPPAPAPRPAPPPITAAEGTTSPAPADAVRELVKRYEQAMESRSLDALKRIWPSIPRAQEDALRNEFRQARAIDMDVDDPNITVTGATAAVTFIRRYHLSTIDSQKLVRTSRTTMMVRRAGGEWLIESMRFEPIP